MDKAQVALAQAMGAHIPGFEAAFQQEIAAQNIAIRAGRLQFANAVHRALSGPGSADERLLAVARLCEEEVK